MTLTPTARCTWILCAGLLTMTGRGVIIAVRSGEQQIGGSGGSLEPPGASSCAPSYRLYGVF
jgi:hypothetical protein